MWEKDQLRSYYKTGTSVESDADGKIKTDGVDNNSEKEALIWEQENNGNGSLTGQKNGETTTEFKQSYWRHDYNADSVDAKDWINQKYYDLIFGPSEHFNKFCWLSCRYVFLYASSCDFGLQVVRADNQYCMVAGNGVYHSHRRYVCT